MPLSAVSLGAYCVSHTFQKYDTVMHKHVHGLFDMPRWSFWNARLDQ